MGFCLDNGKENRNYWEYRDSIRIIGYILELYWDSGKEHGNYDLGLVWIRIHVSHNLNSLKGGCIGDFYRGLLLGISRGLPGV